MRKTAKTNDRVQPDNCARSFWMSGQKAFFGVKVFDPNAGRYSKHTLKRCYSLNGNEKKRHYNTRRMEVDQVVLRLVFTAAGGMGGRCRTFHMRLATLLSLMKGINNKRDSGTGVFL